MDIVYSRKFFVTFILASTAFLLSPALMFGQEPVMRTITLQWDASSSPNVAGYRVHYGPQTGYYPHVLDVGDRTTGDVPNLIEGTTFYFVVTAYSSEGAESEFSEEFHYMPNPPVFLNMSTRAIVGSGDNVMICGFIIGGLGEKKVVVRALGPSLAWWGISGALANPTVEIHGAEGLIATNDNWRDGDNANEIVSLGLAPWDPAEPALIVKLKPGNYSAILRGADGRTGLALLEVYDGSR